MAFSNLKIFHQKIYSISKLSSSKTKELKLLFLILAVITLFSVLTSKTLVKQLFKGTVSQKSKRILPSSAQAWGWDGYIINCHYHPPIPPPNHPNKFKLGVGQHNSQKQSCLPIWVWPINAFGSILGWAWPSSAPACLRIIFVQCPREWTLGLFFNVFNAI